MVSESSDRMHEIQNFSAKVVLACLKKVEYEFIQKAMINLQEN